MDSNFVESYPRARMETWITIPMVSGGLDSGFCSTQPPSPSLTPPDSWDAPESPLTLLDLNLFICRMALLPQTLCDSLACQSQEGYVSCSF